MEIPRKLTPRKVVGTDTDRSATYDFLLVFHSFHAPISYRLRDKGRYMKKKFFHPLYLTPAEMVPLGFCNGGGGSKN